MSTTTTQEDNQMSRSSMQDGPLITLQCAACSKDFTRSIWQHRRNIKRGRKKTYCSALCCNKVHRKQFERKTNPERIEKARQYSTREYCPTCGEKTVAVLETRRNKNGHRYRRKECFACHERTTTYEVPLEFYELITRSKQANICLSCAHNDKASCSFSLPEYLTSESFDCIYYQE